MYKNCLNHKVLMQIFRLSLKMFITFMKSNKKAKKRISYPIK